MTYMCPVCGYDELPKPPEDYAICPSCGTEFGNDDFDQSHAELRSTWIAKQMPWFSRSTSTPKNWSPYRQLIISDHGTDLITHPRFKDELDFRSEVNKAFSEVFISKQLKALREREEEQLTQTQLADKAGMKQSRISELEGMNYSSWSISTLERLAKALGVGFTYSFVPWSDLLSRIKHGLSAEALVMPSFEREMALTNQTVEIKHDAPTLSSSYDPVPRVTPDQLHVDDIIRAALASMEAGYLEAIFQDIEVARMGEDDELPFTSAQPVFFHKSRGPASVISRAVN